MGVADSPDLANLYGHYFESQLRVLNDPLIPFYGRYIDDCLAIVYASSEQEALAKVQYIKFDNCVIEWSASESHQAFLDMWLFKDPSSNTLQHMPYRKARNHMERIPWISHHPLDVKRGTFVGEMSRLATLSSEYSTYLEAIRSLAALYSARGYPLDLVLKWLKDNVSERWEKRLSVTDRPVEEVLVLKTNFNTAWNFFSARELGDTVLGYWREYCIRAVSGAGFDSIRYPVFSASHGGLEGVLADLCSPMPTREGIQLLPDINKIDISNRRLITSRKRTRNLFDLTSLWKKTVLETVENDALRQDIPSINPQDDNADQASSSSDDLENLEHVFLPWNIRHGY